jgi:hypothetical protein
MNENDEDVVHRIKISKNPGIQAVFGIRHRPQEIVDAIRILVRICSDDAIAGALSRSGLVTGRETAGRGNE